jgi:hypothetical protein
MMFAPATIWIPAGDMICIGVGDMIWMPAVDIMIV